MTPTSARPDAFTPAGSAPGCRRIPNLYPRPLTDRPIDVLVVHTNWASYEGSIKSHVNWALAAPGRNTYPHYQHDRDGSAAKMLDSNRRGIGNGGTAAYWAQYGLPTASWRALVYETADRGTIADPAPEGSYFTDEQMASLARDLAYECVVHGIPPVLLDRPDGRGIVGHCLPFGYPAFTTSPGKQCPGHRKYAQLVATVIPWTAAIVAAWTDTPAPSPEPTPPTPDPDPTIFGGRTMILLAHEKGVETFWFSADGGTTRRPVRSMDHVRSIVNAGAVDAVTGMLLTLSSWQSASVLTPSQLSDRLGVAA